MIVADNAVPSRRETSSKFPTNDLFGADGLGHERFDPDARSKAREKDPARGQDPPHLVDHPLEVDAVAREVQYGATDDGLHPPVRPWQRVDRA